MMNNNRNQLNRSLLAFAALQVMPLSLFAQGERPNILYIMCDDHAMQAISAYGSPISKLAPTPNIDRLAERGMKFNEAFVENSLSTPSRACLMTGLQSPERTAPACRGYRLYQDLLLRTAAGGRLFYSRSGQVAHVLQSEGIRLLSCSG